MAIGRMRRDEIFAPGAYPVDSSRYRLDDEPVAPHAHDFCEVAIVLSGQADHRTRYRDRHLTAGDVVAVRPGNWHAFQRTENLDIVNIYIGAELFASDLAWILDHPAWANLIFGTGELSGRLGAPATDRIRRWLQQLADCPSHPGVDHPLQQRSLLGCVFAEVPRAHPAADRSADSAGPAIRAALLAMAETPGHPWQISELAATCNVSASHLQHQFARQLQISPLSWLNQYRAEQMAVQLAAGHRSVAEIGRAIGWPDPNYAARRFRSTYDMSPTMYRRRFGFDSPAPQGDSAPA